MGQQDPGHGRRDLQDLQNLQALPGSIWRESLTNLSNVAIPSTSADASKRLKTSLGSEWNSCTVIRSLIKPTKDLMNF